MRYVAFFRLPNEDLVSREFESTNRSTARRKCEWLRFQRIDETKEPCTLAELYEVNNVLIYADKKRAKAAR